MKKIVTTCFFLCFVLLSAFAQSQFAPKSGDADLDKELVEVNNTAKKNLANFKKDMLDRYLLKNEKVEELLNVKKMEPGDVAMAAKVAKVIDVDIDIVIGTYDKNKGKGWGEIAKQMGIKPGSKEFHELKNSSKGKSKEKGNAKGNGKGKSDSKGNGKGKKK
jgi:hypothetical protein